MWGSKYMELSDNLLRYAKLNPEFGHFNENQAPKDGGFFTGADHTARSPAVTGYFFDCPKAAGPGFARMRTDRGRKQQGRMTGGIRIRMDTVKILQRPCVPVDLPCSPVLAVL
jgi:hypothetical protein